MSEGTKNIKICAITTVSYSMKLFVVDQMKILSENGYDVTFMCDMDDEFQKEFSENYTCYNIEMKRGIDLLGAINAVYKFYKVFKKEKFDIVQYTTPNAALYASIASWLAKVPVRLYCQWGIRYEGFSGVKRRIFKFLEKLTCKYSTTILLDSFGNKNFCVEEGLYTSDKANVIWNGSVNGVDFNIYDIHKKDQFRSEIRTSHGIGNDDFVIGYLGRLMKDKGINELIQAIQLFIKNNSEVKFLIVGPMDISKDINPELLEWAKQQKQIIFAGMTNVPQKYFASFDLFVFPSYREGFGGGVIQAGAFNVPSVVSDIPSLLDSMESGVSGISVPVKSVEPLYLGMKKLYEDNELRKEMGRKQRLFTVNKFDRHKYMQYYFNYINSLLK